MTDLPPRRRFLARLSALALAGAAPLRGADAAAAPAPRRSPAAAGDETDAWIQRLSGKHRQLFHTHDAKDGRALEMTKAFLDIYPKAYGVRESDVNAVVAAHGGMLAMLVSDDGWKDYGLGAMAEVDDPRTRQRATRNVYATEGEGELLGAGASVPSLMKRGVTFLACDNALNHLADRIAAKGKRPRDAVYAEIRARLLPGAVVVPAMIIAIGRAQEHGCTYIYAG